MDNKIKQGLKEAIYKGYTSCTSSDEDVKFSELLKATTDCLIKFVEPKWVCKEEVVGFILEPENFGFITNRICMLLDFTLDNVNKEQVKKAIVKNMNIYSGQVSGYCMFCGTIYDTTHDGCTDSLCLKCATEYSKIADIETLTNKFLTYCKDEHTARLDDNFYSCYSAEQTLYRTKEIINNAMEFINEVLLLEPLYPYSAKVHDILVDLESVLRVNINGNCNKNFRLCEDTLLKTVYRDKDSSIVCRDTLEMLSSNAKDKILSCDNNQHATVLFVSEHEFKFDTVDKIIVDSVKDRSREPLISNLANADLKYLIRSTPYNYIFKIETTQDLEMLPDLMRKLYIRESYSKVYLIVNNSLGIKFDEGLYKQIILS